MTVLVDDPDFTLHVGDVRDVLATLPDESVHCVVTSPPYWGLRDYGTGSWDGGDANCDHAKLGDERIGALTRGSTLSGGPNPDNHEYHRQQFRDLCGKCGARRIDKQLGLEPTPDEYVQNMVAVFREVRRVLRRDGTCWLNIGDSYAGSWGAQGRDNPKAGMHSPECDLDDDCMCDVFQGVATGYGISTNQIAAHPKKQTRTGSIPPGSGLKPKDLCGIPWRLAFALQADGWYLRSDVIWSKPNPMPESVTDRPTKAHEYLFLLTRSPRYFYDADAIREPHRWQDAEQLATNAQARQGYRLAQRRADGDPLAVRTQPEIGRVKGRGKNGDHESEFSASPAGRNRRSVWEIDYDEPEWIGKIGLCPKCSCLKVVGSGPERTITLGMDGSGETENDAHTESSTKSSSVPSRTDSPSTTTARTPDASTPDISSLSPSETTSTEATRRHDETRPRLTARTDTNTLLRTLTSALTEAGIAANVCACDDADNSRRSVWNVATEPYPDAHFATFPQALVEPCVLAGTSEQGCCPVCGAPWERETDTPAIPAELRNRDGGAKMDYHTRQTGGGQNIQDWRDANPTRTTGWRASCKCERLRDLHPGRPRADAWEAYIPVPCVVLDPFMGSGTTAVVARRLGRRAVGIELSAEYAALIVERTKQLSLLA